MDMKFKPFDFVVSIPLAILLVLFLWQPFSSSQSALKYYGHYFVEDPDKNQAYVHEVKDWTNLVNMRYDNGANNSWDYNAASKVRNSGVKVMLQLPLGPDSDQTLFVNSSDRRTYLNKVKQDMLNTNFMSSLAYIAISEEWYVLISQGFYDKWPIFQDHTKEEKFAIAKRYLEEIINDVHEFFPGIPTVIVENILPYPAPPSNVDILGIDAYYIPDNSSCDSVQRAKFEQEVLPYFDAAAPYNKPIMMVPPSFIGGPWKMLSECQMQWYADLALSGQYNIESLIWFFYADTSGFIGVRNYSDLVNYQKVIACQILGGSYCIVPTPTPTPTPTGPVSYTVNLQANNDQYVVAESNGGGAVNANRDVASSWETFNMTDLNGGQLVSGDQVTFVTSDGYYIRAEGGGGSTTNATPRSAGTWETFTVEKPGGGNISNSDSIYLRTSNGTHFVVAEGGGGDVVNANRIAAYAWETFKLWLSGQIPTPIPTPTPTPTGSLTFTPGQLDLSSESSAKNSVVLNNGTILVIQQDGNLVIYDSGWTPLWHSNTWTQNCQNLCRAIFQPDGNFVLYDNNAPYFASMTHSQGATALIFQSAAPYIQIMQNTNTLWINTDGNRF